MGDGTASFREVLRRLRSAASLSQEDLAERAGLSRRGISDLERGLRQAPRLETVRMLADGLGLAAPDRAALVAAARPELLGTAAPEASRPAPTSLPIPLTRLIGREAELAALRRALRDGATRLLTVTGAGGSGKTRLAVEIGREELTHHPDGVAFADLSPLTDANLVVPTIAATLGTADTAGRTMLEALVAHLALKRMLLILDNCERVLVAAPHVTGLLAACPGVTVLATSREPFRVRGEREFPLLPLPAPGADDVPLAELVQVPAVALFVERAAAIRPDFALTTSNAADVAAICRRLDGLPLAIELAAARVTMLPPAVLLARLERRLPVLTGGGRDLPDRHRTMRDAVAWSYDLLSPEERECFRHLAVFAGGFILDAAEAVSSSVDVLDLVAALIDQSLLRRIPAPGDEPRFGMLETMREFALEQLAQSGEEDATRARHANYFLHVARSLGYGIEMHWHLGVLERVAAERDNLRLALEWCDLHERFDEVLEVGNALMAIWASPAADGLAWVDRALERSRHIVSEARAQVLNGAGIQVAYGGDYTRSARYFAEQLAVARELGAPYHVGEALVNLGHVSYRMADYGLAEARLSEALETLRAAPPTALATVLNTARGLLILGDTALVQEEFDRAANCYARALEIAEVSTTDWGLSDIRAGLGGAMFCRGNLARAAQLYANCLTTAQQAIAAENLARARDRSFTPIIVSALLGLAGIAVASGAPDRGARLFGAAEAITAFQGMAIFPRDRPVRERSLASLKASLGEDEFAAARRSGAELTIEQAVAKAASVAATIISASPVAPE